MSLSETLPGALAVVGALLVCVLIAGYLLKRARRHLRIYLLGLDLLQANGGDWISAHIDVKRSRRFREMREAMIRDHIRT